MSSAERNEEAKQKREEEKEEKEKFTSSFSAYREEPSSYKGEKNYNEKFEKFSDYFGELYTENETVGDDNLFKRMIVAFEEQRDEDNDKIMDKKGKLSYDPEDDKNKNSAAEISDIPCDFVDMKFVD